MYNRYIPQPDGSYHRRRMPDPPRPAPLPQQKPESHCPPQQKPESHCPPQQQKPESHCPPPAPPAHHCPPQQQKPPTGHRPPPSRQEGNVGSFLKNLFPDNFDTGDLFIILLLLLMAGDKEEDKNTALLTLALYFYM